MTTIIKGIEQTIDRTVRLGCFAMTTYDTKERVRECYDRYRESLEHLDHAVFLLGLSDAISSKSELRLKQTIQDGIETLRTKSVERLVQIE